MNRPLKAIFFLIFWASTTAYSQVVINEYMCSNYNNFTDNFNDTPDWIELYNTGGAAVNLTGFHLSDRVNNPTKWVIPNINIPANGYVRFWASGRDVVVGTNYHTNFKLTQSEGPETIVFADASGTIIDSVTIKKHQQGHSRGRTSDGAATWSIFTTATPNAANNNPYADYATKPTLSVPPGFYGGPQNVTITCPDPNITIRYTTNGDEPTVGSTVYAGPVNIASTTVLKARAYSSTASILPSFQETNTYFINVNHTIPVVSISSTQVDNLILGNAGLDGTFTYLEYFDKNGNFIEEVGGSADHHGNDSWGGSAHKGIDYVVRDEMGYADEIDVALFKVTPRAKYKRIILKTGASDGYPGYHPNRACHLRDAYIQSLSQRAHMDLDSRSFEWVQLFVNGQYWGLYDLREKVMDPDYTDFYYNQEEKDLDFLSFWGGLQVRYGSATPWNNTYNFIMSNDMTIPANYAQAADLISVTSVIDYYILNTFAVNSDWINWNSMWWQGNKAPKTKWRYTNWDMDNTFDLGENFSGWQTTGFNSSPCDLDDNFANSGPNMGHLAIFNKLKTNPDFKDLFVNRYSELLNSYLNCTFALAFLDSIVAVMTPEMPAHIQRWGGNMPQWQNNIQYMKNQIQGRCNVVNQGIVDCYDVDGPFNVVVLVDPPGSGNVKFGNQQLSAYPWSGTYFGGVNIPMEATPQPTWNFWYWELKNHTVLPDTVTDIVSFALATGDTIIAHFKQDLPFDLTVRVMPPLSGNASISGFTPPAYPWTGSYIDQTLINLNATPFAGYLFDHWELAHHTVNPNDTVQAVSFTVGQQDTIIAHFVKIEPPAPSKFSLTVDVSPVNAGKVNLNTNLIGFYPFTTQLDSNTQVNLTAVPDVDYVFAYWTIKHHVLNPDTISSFVNFNLSQNDTVIAYFVYNTTPPEETPVIYIPNSFTPDGDMLNDIFRAFPNQSILDGELLIFSRWGELIYKSDAMPFGWDGKYGNKDCEQGVYNYVLNYNTLSSGRKTLTGSVLLIR